MRCAVRCNARALSSKARFGACAVIPGIWTFKSSKPGKLYRVDTDPWAAHWLYEPPCKAFTKLLTQKVQSFSSTGAGGQHAAAWLHFENQLKHSNNTGRASSAISSVALLREPLKQSTASFSWQNATLVGSAISLFYAPLLIWSQQNSNFSSHPYYPLETARRQ